MTALEMLENYKAREARLKSSGARTDRVNLQAFCKKCKKEYSIDVFMQDVIDAKKGIIVALNYLPEDELFIMRREVCITCG